MPVSTEPGPSSRNAVTPSATIRSTVWRHRTGEVSCAVEEAGPLVGVLVGEGVDVGDDGHLGIGEGRRGEGGARGARRPGP